MEVLVEGCNTEESKNMQKLIEDTFKDTGLAKRIEKFMIKVDIGIPAFYVACRFKKEVPAVYLRDIAKIREQGKLKRIQVTQERYYGDVITALWERFGPEIVSQTERNFIEINDKNATLEDMKIIDPTEKMRERIINALWNILPEGFKVRHFKHFTDGFIVVTTDSPKIKEFHKEMKKIAGKFGEEWNV
ncbi:MAG: methanogenesis marker 17 protein [Candidatus Methanofastidiosia archaeon]